MWNCSQALKMWLAQGHSVLKGFEQGLATAWEPGPEEPTLAERQRRQGQSPQASFAPRALDAEEPRALFQLGREI